jgi:hypothetical protein
MHGSPFSSFPSHNSTSHGKKTGFNQAQQGIPVFPALRRLRQDDYEFEATLGYIDPASKKEGQGKGKEEK